MTVPILALAAGAEARAVRDRLRRPDSDWEREFEAHQASHEFDPAKPPAEVLEYFKGVPGVSKAYVVERLLAVGSAIVWLVVFVLLAITELLCLVWLGDSTGCASLKAPSIAPRTRSKTWKRRLPALPATASRRHLRNRAVLGDGYHGCLRIDVRRSSDLYRKIEGWADAVMAGPGS